MNKLICILLFFLTTANIKAQDTLCYKEIDRYKGGTTFLSNDIIPSYTHNWLFHLEKNEEKKEAILKLYKSDDTLSRILPKEYYYSNIATDEKGNVVVIAYWNHVRVGISRICFLDSLLITTQEVKLKTNSCLEMLREHTFYSDIKYVRDKKNEIILATSPQNFSVILAVDLKTMDLSEHKFGFDPYLYDWGFDKGDKVIIDYPKAFYIHEGRIYYYQHYNSITKESGKIIGNISSTYLNSGTLFIKNGFVTQLKNKDIVFFKFCD